MTHYRIKDWGKFQHYKTGTRSPDWIKLYRDILDDFEWHELDPKAAKCLVMLWLVASENDGQLPSLKTLAFRLRMKESELNQYVNSLSHWLEQDDSNALADCYQSDSLEEEKKRIEREEEVSAVTPKASRTPPKEHPRFLNEETLKVLPPSGVLIQLDPNFALPDQWGEDMERLGHTPDEILTQAEKFRQYWVHGKGSGKRRTAKGWRQSWSTWMTRSTQWSNT